MQRTIRVSLILTMLAWIPSATARAAAADTPPAAVKPTLEVIVGKVAAVSGDVLVNGAEAAVGQTLLKGAVIETRDGRATLLLGKGSVVQLDPGSRFRVAEYTDTAVSEGTEAASLDLSYGRTRAIVKSGGPERKRFRIRTRSATLGVRGTDVVVETPRAEAEPSRFVVLDGQAELFVSLGGDQGMAEISDASLGDARKFRRLQLPPQTEYKADAPGKEAGSEQSPRRMEPDQLKRLRKEIGLQPREVATLEDVDKLQRDKRERRKRPVQRLIRALTDQYTFDPILDGGVRIPTNIQIPGAVTAFDP
ncbi:MAG: FecR domain-containing protein [Bdellovibrionales bacterium]|nr:FecR domain-containing protein [Bdellovibrionales bacterium]